VNLVASRVARLVLHTYIVIIFVVGIAHAEPITFTLDEASVVTIDGDSYPLMGSFELEYSGLVDEGWGGGANDESFVLMNLQVGTETLIFEQVDSPYTGAVNIFDESDAFVAGGFQLVTHVVGTIEGIPVDVVFQWGALDDGSFIGNMEFDDGDTLGLPGNDEVVNYAAGHDGTRVYDFRVFANSETPTGVSGHETLGAIKSKFR